MPPDAGATVKMIEQNKNATAHAGERSNGFRAVRSLTELYARTELRALSSIRMPSSTSALEIFIGGAMRMTFP
jgi:hypothetical protein